MNPNRPDCPDCEKISQSHSRINPLKQSFLLTPALSERTEESIELLVFSKWTHYIFLTYVTNQINMCTLNMRKTALATSNTPVKNTAKTADHFGKIGQIDIFDTRYGIAGIATK